jgi:hypothetical protein
MRPRERRPVATTVTLMAVTEQHRQLWLWFFHVERPQAASVDIISETMAS